MTRSFTKALWFLSMAMMSVQVVLAGEHKAPSTELPPLTLEQRGALELGAADPALTPWQREVMLSLTRDDSDRGPYRIAHPLSPQNMAAEGSDGIWAPLLPQAYASSAIYDPLRDRMVVFGGFSGDDGARNEAWAFTLTESPAWTAIVPSGSPPPARAGHTAIYDPVRDRMVVFGGLDDIYRNDVWALSFSGTPSWSELTPSGSPPPGRYLHTAVYDPLRDRMVVFGGYDGTYRSDTWALSFAGGPSWSPLTPAGIAPAGRYGHAAIYDPLRDRMLVFGGIDTSRHYRDDVWTLILSGDPEWDAITPSGSPPSGRAVHTAIYDPIRDRMVVFGGIDAGYPYPKDSWELTLSGSLAWNELTPSGTVPLGRYGHTSIFDPIRDRMVVFGGIDGVTHHDVWALTLSASPAWSEMTPSGPSELTGHTAIHDPVRNRMLVFGGYDWRTGNRNDTWALSLSGNPAWSVLSPSGTRPTARTGHTAIYDPVRDRMLMFGGLDGTSFRNDVWELSLSGSSTWSELTPSGNPPAARTSHAAIYDPVRDQMVIFGGGHGSGNGPNDTWALELSGSPEWIEIPTGNPPPLLIGHTAIYDPTRDAMIVFGGGAVVHQDSVLILTLSGTPQWSAIAPPGGPPTGLHQHTAIFDPVRNRMVVFGGQSSGVPSPGYLNDAWALSLSGSPAWSLLAPAMNRPEVHFQHTAIYDPQLDRMVVFGGFDASVWALNWDFATTPVQLSLFTCERMEGGVRVAWVVSSSISSAEVWLERADAITGPWERPVTEESHERDAIIALDRTAHADKSYWYRLMVRETGFASVIGQPTRVGALEGLRFGLLTVGPNPGSGPLQVAFTVGRDARVELDAFDVLGRMVASLARGVWPAGRHEVIWPVLSGNQANGLYFVRFKYPGGEEVRRVVRSE